ncbi:MAG: hypothetical protein QOG56_754, partial [Solirubrobacteraceae bacterium]|nr:hypothetical protein [Solirubrobacteraceae bacterium]
MDERLAPAGLTRLLGSRGAGRVWVLASAGLLIAAACVVRVVVTTAPPVTLGLAFIVAVTLIASQFGTRAGLASAGVAIVAMST